MEPKAVVVPSRVSFRKPLVEQMDHLHNLRVFAEVVRHRSFSGAARSMNVSAASASRAVQILERQVGLTLLERTTRSVRPTGKGNLYVQNVARLLAMLDDSASALARAQQAGSGPVRLGAAPAVASHIVIPSLQAFRKTFPHIALTISPSSEEGVMADAVDCLLSIDSSIDTSLVARRIGCIPLACCASPSYLSRNGYPAHPAALFSGHDVLRRQTQQTCRARPLTLEQNGERYVIKGNTPLSVGDDCALIASGVAGQGVIQVGLPLVRDQLACGALKPVLEKWWPSSPVLLVYAKNPHMSRRVRAFIDWAMDGLAQDQSSFSVSYV